MNGRVQNVFLGDKDTEALELLAKIRETERVARDLQETNPTLSNAMFEDARSLNHKWVIMVGFNVR